MAGYNPPRRDTFKTGIGLIDSLVGLVAPTEPDISAAIPGTTLISGPSKGLLEALRPLSGSVENGLIAAKDFARNKWDYLPLPKPEGSYQERDSED